MAEELTAVISQAIRKEFPGGSGMGPSLRRLQPSRTALLVIDMQRDFLDPGGYAAKAGLDISRLREADHVRSVRCWRPPGMSE